MTMRTARGAAFLLLASPLLAGCGGLEGGTKRQLMENAGAWFTGVHELRFDLLAKHDAEAPAPGAPGHDEWAERVGAAVQRYEAQKLEGRWEPDEKGYATARALLLGANPGTFWGAPGREGTNDAPVLVIKATFAYDEIADQGLPEGTVVYVQGFPVGTVHRLTLGGPQREVDILETLQLRVHFRRAEGAREGEPGYKVERLTIVDGSATHRRVKWVY